MFDSIKMSCLSLLFILIFSCEIAKTFVLPEEVCGPISCRPGRECRAGDPGGEPHCDCIQRCPDNWKPVCGSDGTSYDNHCELHRAACITGSPISPLHSGFCRKDREIMVNEDFFEEMNLTTESSETNHTILLPTACFENDRNRLREFMISWFQLISKSQVWYSHGMTYPEELWGHFFNMDSNGDNYLDSEEMLDYLNKNKTEGKHKERNKELRQMCLDALVEEGDRNFDWRLSYSEYKALLSHSYIPSSKVCNLDGQMFEDGKETSVECNGCVCACGKWICTSNKCQDGFRNQSNFLNFIDKSNPTSNNNNNNNLISKATVEEEDKDYSDEEEYSDEDYEYPEDDPDVQDIDWF